MTPEQIAKHTSLYRQLRDAKAQIVALEMRVKTARDDALREAVLASKEPIAVIVYDGWCKKDWPVTSHGYQKVQEAVNDAILALIQTTPTDTSRPDAATEE